jgi:hypothetical protein
LPIAEHGWFGVANPDNERWNCYHSLHLRIYKAHRACGKPEVVPHNRRPQARTGVHGRREMRLLLSTHGSYRDAEPMARLALELRALGAEGCDALVATGIVPAGVRR